VLLLAQIILTVIVWKKGWKWLSLIPIGVCLLFGLLIGLSGGEPSSGIFIDIIAIVALIIMLTKQKISASKDGDK
jgi:hypothetical protein